MILASEVLQARVPGCVEMSGSVKAGLRPFVAHKVRSVKATFRGAVTLSHIVEGEGLTLNGEGIGGQPDLQKEIVANNAEVKEAYMGVRANETA